MSASAARVALLVLLTATSACGGKAVSTPPAPAETTLVGQLLLPSGAGSRGVEVEVDLGPSTSGPPTVWVLFDEQGRFSHPFDAEPIRVRVTAGSEIHRIEVGDLPETDAAGRIDLQTIDLRDRLLAHRLQVRAADGASGDVRVGMFSGPPPVGPMGEPVSLGSRQFPTRSMGADIEWLVPREAQGVHFLVELPADAARGVDWRSGPQQLFGPYTSADLPTELKLD